MSLLSQLFWGSVFLSLCAVVHVLAIGFCANWLSRLSASLTGRRRFVRLVSLVSVGFVLITLSHTIQVWVWAKAFMLLGVITDLNTSLYFALVTYATVGYGDVVLGPGTRIFGAFAGVSGVLTLGVSTAFLVAVLGRLLSNADGKASDNYHI